MEEEIKKLIIGRYGSINNFCKQFDFPWSTVKTMLTRGIKNSSISNVIKLCKALNLDIEELTKDKIVSKQIKLNEIGDDYMLIACHHETGKLTEEEKEEIKQFAEFVKKRNK
jgi:hypothetical protein